MPLASLAPACGSDVRTRSRDQIQHILVGNGSFVPAVNRLRKRGAGDELVVDVIAGAIVGARVRHLKACSNGIGLQLRSAPLVVAQVSFRGLGNDASGRKVESGTGMQRIGCAAFLHDVICAVDHVMPWASVPMVVAAEKEDARALRSSVTLKSSAS